MVFGMDDVSFEITADASDAMRSISDVEQDLVEMAATSEIAGKSLDDVGDSFSTIGSKASIFGSSLRKATGSVSDIGGRMGRASGSAVTFAATLTGASAAASALTGIIDSGLVPALVILTTTMAPIAGIAIGLSGAFAAILGTGFLAWSNKAGNSLSSLKKEIVPLLRQFGEQFIPLINDAVNALPRFVSSVLDATGNMKPFVRALRGLGKTGSRIIPKLVGFFFDLARTALPALRTVGGFIARNFVPALKSFISFGRTVNSIITGLALSLWDFIAPLRSGLGWVLKLGAELFSLGKAALSAEKDIGGIGKTVLRTFKGGVRNAVKWIAGNAIPSVKNAFKTLVRKATDALGLFRTRGLPKIKTGLSRIWDWIKGPGAKLAKKAFNKLWGGIKKSFNWLKTDGKKAVKKGWKKVRKWVKGPGKKTAKKAFNKLWNGAGTAFDWLKTDGKRLTKIGLKRIAKWIKGPGKQLLRASLTALWKYNIGKLGWQQRIRGWAQKAVKKAKKWISSKGLQLFRQAFRELGRKLGQSLVGYLSFVHDAYKIVIPRIRKWLANNGTDIIKKGFKAIGKGIRLSIISMFAMTGLIGQALISSINGIRSWLEDGGKRKLRNAFENIISGIVSYLRNSAWGDLKAASTFLFDVMIAAMKGVAEGLIGKSVIPEMIGDIVSYLRNGAYQDLKSGASKMFDGIIEAASSMASNLKQDLKEAATGAADDFVSGFNNAIPSSIPMPHTTIDAGTVAGQDLGEITIGGGSIGLPQLAGGGLIKESGMAVVHKGEGVLTPEMMERIGGGDMYQIKIDVDASDRDDADDIGTAVADEFRSVLSF